MHNHTPGPWTVDGKSKNSHQAFIIKQDCGEEWGPIICWTATRGYDTERDRPAICAEDKANARLIAKAPELYWAARCALADLEGIMPEFEPSGDREHPAWKTIKLLKKILK